MNKMSEIKLNKLIENSEIEHLGKNTIISIKNVRKVYNADSASQTIALKNINLDIDKGEYISIIGPSGSGKSTLLQVIGCMDNVSSGKIYIDGIDVTKIPENKLASIRKLKIGFIFQSNYLIESETVLGNILAPLIPYKIKKDDQDYALYLLDIVGLKSKKLKKINQLSGGEQQRVAICRSLINKPSILFADEATGNLDSSTGIKIIKLLEKFNKELDITVILVTHNLSLAKRTKRKIEILDGHIIQDVII